MSEPETAPLSGPETAQVSEPETEWQSRYRGAGLDILGRAGRGRLAPVAGGQRAVQQVVLRSFAATGRPPQFAAVTEAAAASGADPREVLAGLHAADFLRLDDAGQIQAAYPFSATPTCHRVQIAAGAEVYAMCAIDALGIAPMLGAAVLIRSADPVTGQAITVTMPAAGGAVWDPDTAVVFSGRHAGGSGCAAPAAEVTCGLVNFFTSHATAAAWAARHPEATGTTLGQSQAQQLGAQIFGSLLTGPRCGLS